MSFRREKYVPAGGPDGGDGGRGGDVVVVADADDPTLSQYREKRRFAAQHGRPGAGGRRHGRDGAVLELHVPPGTVVSTDGQVLADLDVRDARVVVAHGGRGGRGNARFATSTRQAPRMSELGEAGEHRQIHLELKLIADVGLVGLPNAGKSTLLAAVSAAHPKIADYPFTTLHPNLGVAETSNGRTIVVADVPGLIEGAHRGVGLGLEFLRHLERTQVLIHVVDTSQGVEESERAIATVERELMAFGAVLAERPRLLALNKVDLPAGAVTAAALIARLPNAFAISAADHTGCTALVDVAAGLVASRVGEPQPVAPAQHRVYRHRASLPPPVVARERDAFRVSAPDLERLVAMTDLDSDEAVVRLQRALAARGVDSALAAAGCVDGDTVYIGAFEFSYVDGEMP